MKRLTISITALALFSAVPLFGADTPPATPPDSGAPPAQGQGQGLLRQLNETFVNVYEKVAPAVVVIEVTKKATASGQTIDPFDFRFFFRNDPDDEDKAPQRKFRVPQRPQQSEGSGFLVRGDGYIFTNNHVVADADKINVRLKDGRQFAGKVVGNDDKTDVAVIKIDGKDLPMVELADSDKVRVGELCCAIGAPYNLDYTFTLGVVSAKGRSNFNAATYEEYIQTDASINPGNSGGPLCNLDGKVIGMNTLINGINRGLGFAIPINMAGDVGMQLIATGKIVRPWLGIRIETLGEDSVLREMFKGVEKGVIVRTIEPATPAYGSELRQADVITEVDGVPVASSRELQKQILKKKVGQEVNLTVWRKGKTRAISVKTGELPQDLTKVTGVKPEPKPEKPEEIQLFGLQVQDVNKDLASKLNLRVDKGVLVTDVAEDSPAAQADIQREDVITEVDSKPVTTVGEFKEALDKLDTKRGVVLYIDRKGGKTFTVLKPEK